MINPRHFYLSRSLSLARKVDGGFPIETMVKSPGLHAGAGVYSLPSSGATATTDDRLGPAPAACGLHNAAGLICMQQSCARNSNAYCIVDRSRRPIS